MRMMDNNRSTLAVVLGGGRGTRLYPLTAERAKPAVPLGGKYRLIDVPISNCLNSGLNKIHVLTQFESRSLNQHVNGSYRFDRFNGGFVEILAAQQSEDNDSWYQGTADAVRQNMRHMGENFDEVLILSGDQLYHMDFRKLLHYHRQTSADVSLCVLPASPTDAPSLGIVHVDETGRVKGFTEKPPADKLAGLETDEKLFQHFGVHAEGRPYLASMGIYVFNRPVLYRELLRDGNVDFGKHVFPEAIKHYKVQAYVWDDYWEDIGTVKSFHEANLALARRPANFSFYTQEGMIYTRPRILPGSIFGRIDAKETIVTEGCRIGDLTAENSVVGIRSIIGDKVSLKRTLVMGADYYETDRDMASNRAKSQPNTGIGNNVIIEDAIVDKNVHIGNNVIIRNPDKVSPPRTSQYVVRDGVICLLKGAIIPDGTRIGE